MTQTVQLLKPFILTCSRGGWKVWNSKGDRTIFLNSDYVSDEQCKEAADAHFNKEMTAFKAQDTN